MTMSGMGVGMMIVGLALLIGALGLVVLGAVWLAGVIGRSDRQAPSVAASTAIGVLHHRYAQGTIDGDELAHRLAQGGGSRAHPMRAAPSPPPQPPRRLWAALFG